jgi:iron complex transport system ATP-binding protein
LEEERPVNRLATEALTLSYGTELVIEELDLTIPQGKITVFVGSNGCGKSTLLRALARLLKPLKGSVLLDGKEMMKWPTREVAKQLAILPQGPVAPEGLTVFQLVSLGRHPYQNWHQRWSEEDERMVRKALNETRMEPFADRTVDSLSGGQRQRAWIAMTLAQGTDVILLDEPTTYLDLTHQIEILDLLYELNERENRTIVMVLHDLNLAARYAHHMIAIHNRKIHAQGKPEEIITRDMIRQVFGLECEITYDPLFGTPLCIPHGKGRKLLLSSGAS